MDIKHINPFVESFSAVMPQLGFESVGMGAVTAKGNEITGTGIAVILGIVGSVRGNVVYMLTIEAAKQIASVMMGGMDVEEFDDDASSAISELTNMLTANAATSFANAGVVIDISTPTMLQGVNMSIKMSAEQTLCVELVADSIPIEVNLSFER